MGLLPPNPGIELIECPSCKKKQCREARMYDTALNLMHAGTGKFYSDGRVTGIYHTRTEFTSCPKCGAFFRIENPTITNEIPFIPILGMPGMVITLSPHHYPSVKILTEDEYHKAITTGLKYTTPPEEEKLKDDMLALRKEFWMSLNIKGMAEACSHTKTIYEDNCREILTNIDGKSDEDYLIMAELHRNLCEFEQCRACLKKVKNQYNFYDALITAISDACEAENTYTVCVVIGSLL
jgi:uncharacterized C2H2 Zn-finger protein